jgi:hypothetical protein
MTTRESNKLLAEFLGYTQPHPDYPHTTYWYKKDEAPLTMLSFDTDWNWLMEVVRKICQICIDEDNMERYWEITDYMPTLTEVYEGCVEFVQWYNEQNK